ncbi:MAG TPA: YabP/YqfC family sporulation protein [Oscillospiraceae bacterium]|nr:YabP/YqfC family sporulation protein [Oscillospiraceae bacterium]HPF56639.1 YabP/YqfC family sporulation protein [Clostridiales bacterium]HPK36626.1 YabP/YqfC family sporulation protein [Oscillospiraceae bacterium]HPR76840.1 YabP/YqfC family sporulation protein [Oscillospiraceae bacterium]
MEEKTGILTSAMSKDSVQISVSGRTLALVEGCLGVLEYSREAIRLSTGKSSVRFSGEALSISSMNKNSVVVSGKITNIAFLGANKC